jgi:hypothetical protein
MTAQVTAQIATEIIVYMTTKRQPPWRDDIPCDWRTTLTAIQITTQMKTKLATKMTTQVKNQKTTQIARSPLIRVSSKQTNFFSVRTETNRNTICFGWFSVCFAKPKNYFFGLFRCFGPVLKQPKQTDLFRNKPKKRKEPNKTAM